MSKGGEEEDNSNRVNASEDGDGAENAPATPADRETAEQSKALGSLTSQVRFFFSLIVEKTVDKQLSVCVELPTILRERKK